VPASNQAANRHQQPRHHPQQQRRFEEAHG
jgi:hypothetical protein